MKHNISRSKSRSKSRKKSRSKTHSKFNKYGVLALYKDKPKISSSKYSKIIKSQVEQEDHNQFIYDTVLKANNLSNVKKHLKHIGNLKRISEIHRLKQVDGMKRKRSVSPPSSPARIESPGKRERMSFIHITKTPPKKSPAKTPATSPLTRTRTLSPYSPIPHLQNIKNLVGRIIKDDDFDVDDLVSGIRKLKIKYPPKKKTARTTLDLDLYSSDSDDEM